MKGKAFTGIMLTLFLVATLFTAIPIEAQEGDPIKIAVVGPQGWIQWDGIWVGAVMAKDIINDAGGIVTGDGLHHYIELKAVDSHAVPEPEPAAGWIELLSALEPPFSADFVLGGFRTECVAPMRLNFITYAKDKYDHDQKAPIWIIAGASTDELIDCLGTGACGGTCMRCNPDLGRYMFRVTPMCGSELVAQYAMFLRFWVIPFKLGPIYGGDVVGEDPGPLVGPPYPEGTRLFRDLIGVQPPVYANHIKTYLVMEDLTWTAIMGLLMEGEVKYPPPPDIDALLGPNVEVVGYDRTHALTPVFEPTFGRIDDSDARLIIHIYSAVTGVDFIKTWGERRTKAVCVGINVESQMQEFWEKSGGKCEYETFLASLGTGTNLNPDAEPYSTAELWNLYKERSDDILTEFWKSPMPSTYPIYTMWGSYDAILGLGEQIEKFDSWPTSTSGAEHTNTVITSNEATVRSGPLGTFMYTQYHDVYTDPGAVTPNWSPPYLVRSHITQWQAGRMEVVWPMNCTFSRRYKVPPWMYSLAETDVFTDPTTGLPVPNGLVDVYDIGFLAGAWLKRAGETGWNIEVDMDNNGVINIFDASRIGKDYGKSYITEGYPSWPLP